MTPSNPDYEAPPPPLVNSSPAFLAPDEAGYADLDGGSPAAGRTPEDEMGRKRAKVAGRYKPEPAWQLNRTVFNRGVTAAGAGTILYKGKDAASGKYKFLLRHQWYEGTERRTAGKLITAANASEAERQLNASAHELRNGRIRSRLHATFAEYVEDTWVPQRRPRLAGSTMISHMQRYRARIKPFLGHLRPDELTADVLRDWVATNASGPTITRQVRRKDGSIAEREVRLSTRPRTVKNAKALLTTILNDMADARYLAQSPMPRSPRRKSRKEKVEVLSATPIGEEEYWTHEEVASFWTKGLPVARGEQELRYPGDRNARDRRTGRTGPRFDRMRPYRAATTFMFGAFGLAFGTRPGEACAARWRDLTKTQEGWVLDVSASIGVPDADQLVLANCPRWDRTPTKTGVQATVSDTSGFVEHFLLPFRAEQERLIAEGKLRNPDGYIFVQTDGSFCNPNLMRDRWRQLLSGLGLRAITLYGLRHTHATLLLEDGVPIEAISARLRHSCVAVTSQVYAHVTARLKQRTSDRVSAAGLVPSDTQPQVDETPRAMPPRIDQGPDEGLQDEAPASDVGQAVSLDAWRRRRQA